MNRIATPLPTDRRPPSAETFVHLRVLEWALGTARHFAADGHAGRLVHDLLDAVHNTPAHILGEFCADQDLYPVMYARFDQAHPDCPGGPIRAVMETALAEYRNHHGHPR